MSFAYDLKIALIRNFFYCKTQRISLCWKKSITNVTRNHATENIDRTQLILPPHSCSGKMKTNQFNKNFKWLTSLFTCPVLHVFGSFSRFILNGSSHLMQSRKKHLRDHKNEPKFGTCKNSKTSSGVTSASVLTSSLRSHPFRCDQQECWKRLFLSCHIEPNEKHNLQCWTVSPLFLTSALSTKKVEMLRFR